MTYARMLSVLAVCAAIAATASAAPGNLTFAVTAADCTLTPTFSDTPGASTVAFDVVYTLEGRAASTAQAVFLLDDLTVDSVQDAVGALDHTFVRDPAGGPGTLTVTLRQPLAQSAHDAITIRYHGVPACAPDPVKGFAGCRVERDVSYLHGGTVFPAKVAASDADARDLFDLSLHAVLPAGWHAVASAEFVGEVEDAGGTITSHWHAPAAHEIAAAFAPYSVVEGQYRGVGASSIFVRSYVTSKEADANAEGYRDLAGEALKWFSATYQPYAYPSFGFCEVPSAVSTAAAAPMLGLIPSAFLGSSPDQAPAAVTVAYLAARQWWGAMMRAGDAASTWLIEGLVSYSALEFENAKYGPSVPGFLNYFTYLNEMLYEYGVGAQKDVPLGSPALSNADRDTYSILTHSKASMVVKQLEGILGAKFPPALQGFSTINLDKWVTTSAFQATLETMQGGSLEWYFSEWLGRKGLPVYTISWDVTPNGNLWDVRVDLKQASSIAGDPPFDMPVEFGVYTASSATPVTFSGRASDPDERYGTTSVERPTLVLMDPGGKMPLKRVVSAVPGDVNVDMEVDGRDLLYAAWSYGDRFEDLAAGRGIFLGFADLNRDGVIDDEDLNAVIGNFGACALSACAAK